MPKITKPQLLNIEFHCDDRGYLVPLTNNLDRTLQKKIKRTYVVGNFSKGVIRGLHFHKKEIKIFYIARGAAKFVAINPKLPKKDFYAHVLSDKKSALFIIPPGYANGWVSLSDNTILISLSTSTFQESVKDDIRFSPYEWGDIWNIRAR
ncbi:MAG: dTDP-4-dehydrorhamnose 3,5-epimerase family protein [Patescibacteria group bacterium]